MIFPGSLSSVQKDISQDFLRRLTTQVETISSMTANLSATLLIVFSGNMTLEEASLDPRTIQNVLNIIESLKKLCIWLTNTKSKLENTLSTDDKDLLLQLQLGLSDLASSLQTLSPYLQQLSVRTYMLLMNDHRLKIALTKCLHASELLKTLSVSIRPKKNESNGILHAIVGLFRSREGPSGMECISFVVMREQLYSSFGAECISIPVNKGNNNSIDAAIIPSTKCLNYKLQQQSLSSSTPSSSSSSSSPVATTPSANSNIPTAIGTVLFCNPNAGFYECLSQSQRDNSWLGLYTQLGFDVVVFNYRGYLQSKGVPTPEGIKADGEAVVRYLKDIRGVKRLVVHGESIGGMVACHIAKSTDIDLLVVDRSFASLQSLAGRLVGQWAEVGLKYLTFWNTDVVNDFMQSHCAKLILQDPNDEIIHDGASLKSGLATYKILGDRQWHKRFLAKEYAIADAIGRKISHDNTDHLILQVKDHTSTSLSEEFIYHFFACITEIVKRIGLNIKKSKGKNKNMSTNGSSDSDENDEDEDDIDSCNSDNNNTSNSSNGTTSKGSYGALKGDQKYTPVSSSSSLSPSTDNDIDRDSNGNDIDRDMETGIELSDLSRNKSDNRELSDEEKDDTGIGIGHGNGGIGGNGIGRDGKGLKALQTACSSNEEWLHVFCNLDVQDGGSIPLTAAERAWVIIARTDGACGELLGQAFSKGFDSLRKWLCCMLYWSARSSPDVLLPRGKTDLQGTVMALKELVEVRYKHEMRNDKTIHFLLEGLEALYTRQEILKREADSQDVLTQMRDTGHVIPLHCGHNGWPGNAAVGSLIRMLNIVNFEVSVDSSPNMSRPRRQRNVRE
eukprot:gene10249-21380_t